MATHYYEYEDKHGHLHIHSGTYNELVEEQRISGKIGYSIYKH